MVWTNTIASELHLKLSPKKWCYRINNVQRYPSFVCVFELQVTANVILTVFDTNDHAPIFNASYYVATVSEVTFFQHLQPTYVSMSLYYSRGIDNLKISIMRQLDVGLRVMRDFAVTICLTQEKRRVGQRQHLLR